MLKFQTSLSTPPSCFPSLLPETLLLSKSTSILSLSRVSHFSETIPRTRRSCSSQPAIQMWVVSRGRTSIVDHTTRALLFLIRGEDAADKCSYLYLRRFEYQQFLRYWNVRVFPTVLRSPAPVTSRQRNFFFSMRPLLPYFSTAEALRVQKPNTFGHFQAVLPRSTL